MQRYTLLKLFGLTLLTQVVLMGISFVEVFIYSITFKPGQDESFYEAHAMVSAPWISGIFGFILFFLVVRYWTRKNLPNAAKLALLYPLVYVTWDLLIVMLIGVPDWLDFLPIFVSANAAKLAGSLGGHYLYREPHT